MHCICICHEYYQVSPSVHLMKLFVCFYKIWLKQWTITKTKKLRGLSPQANYTDRATVAVGEVVPTFADRGVLCGQRNGSPRPLISVF
jgi:hypothetical protein